MNFTKTFAVLAASVAFAATADVEALYWQVTEASNVNNVQFTAAALGVNDGSSTFYLPNGSSSGNQWISASQGGLSTQEAAAILGEGDHSGWSFFIELQNYDAQNGWYTSGRSDNYTYAQVQNNIFSTSGVLSTAPAAWTPSTPVPEPTSGMLLLIGGALLALRRRRS